MSDQDEALRLAAWLEQRPEGPGSISKCLRRQHAENERLRAECDALRRHLNYWLPDETMIPQGHESAYRAACAALASREAK